MLRRICLMAMPLMVAGVLVAGCNDQEPRRPAEPTEEPREAPPEFPRQPVPPASPEDIENVQPPEFGNVVVVRMQDYAFEMPDALPAGRTTFHVTNAGQAPHNFRISGEDMDRAFDSNLSPGETRTLTVDLRPGRYRIVCPVGNHEELGMARELNVQQQAAQ